VTVETAHDRGPSGWQLTR